MAMPIKRSANDGLVKSKLLRWVGIFPECVPRMMVWAGHRSHEHHHYAEDLQDEQDKILEEYGAKLEETAGKILAAFIDLRGPDTCRSTLRTPNLAPQRAAQR